MTIPAPLWLITVALVLVSASVSYLLCWLMRLVAPRIGYVDSPGGRKNHTRVMPLGGGLAVFATFFLLVLTGLIWAATAGTDGPGTMCWFLQQTNVAHAINQMGGVLLGGLILMVLGLFDDVKNLGPKLKLAIQFMVAGLVVIGFNVRLTLFIEGVPLGQVLSILWIVVLVNAFNFLDNADGLSSGVALVCGIVLLSVALVGGQILVGAFLACLAGALAGFLIHNFPPARIFLGDAGSLVVGYLLAIGTLLTTYYNEQNPGTSKTSVLIPLVVMAIPLYDFGSVILLRLRSGTSPFVGDHRHFSHRLLRRGLSVRQTVLTIYLACGGTAVGAIMLRHLSGLPAILIFIQTLCIVAIIGILEYQPKNGNHS